MNNNFPVISYSQINRRVNALDLDFPAKESKNIIFEEDIVGADASGIKVSNRGEWIRHKWKVQRGWIKVVVLGNKKGRVVDVMVGVEDELNENESSRAMLKIHHKTISKFLGDRIISLICHTSTSIGAEITLDFAKETQILHTPFDLAIQFPSLSISIISLLSDFQSQLGDIIGLL